MPLFVLATPIGNLGDLTPRAEEVLRSADVLFCEDTRVTRRLLSARGLRTPTLRAADAHRELQVVDELVERLRRGERVVFMSDAGTPGISDPGGRLVEAAHAAGQVVVPVPGPSSVITALSASGLPATPFHFVGYPPRAGGPRRRWIEAQSRLPGTLVMLESGRRAGASSPPSPRPCPIARGACAASSPSSTRSCGGAPWSICPPIRSAVRSSSWWARVHPSPSQTSRSARA